MSNIKIFVSNRIDLESAFFNSTILYPVRCGAIYDQRSNVKIQGDDIGDNISERRMTFCELTVQYWAWKNVDADYYGLFHYRRFFNFRKFNYPEDPYGSVIDEYINNDSAKVYGLQDENMRSIIDKYDLILPRKRDVSTFPEQPKSIWDHWCKAPDLHEEDLKIMLSVIAQMHPDYYQAAKEYLDGHYGYFCAMHIMKKNLFQSYCEWLYPILFKLEEEIDISHYTQEGQRTVGHLAERLLGIYILQLKKDHPEIKIKELQTVLFQQPKLLPVSLEPVFSKKEKVIPIVFSTSNAFASVCSVAINSVLKNLHSSFYYDIVILESGIPEKDKKLIRSMAGGIKNVSIRFFNVLTKVSEYYLAANEHIAIETYYRFLIQSILPQYDKVLYLDGDLVCNKDVAELYQTNVDGYMLAAVRDPDMGGQMNISGSEVIRYLVREVQMKNPYDYFQAGVLLLNTAEMRKAYTVEEWLSFAQKRYKYMDQDVLNRYCQGRVLYLDMAWNVLIDCNNYRVPVLIKASAGDVYQEYHKARENPYIVHFAGFQKPWNQRGVDFEEEFWKYARDTPYYEYFLLNIIGTPNPTTVDNGLPPIGVKGALKIYIKKKANKWCPVGSRRRAILRRLFTRFF